MLALDHVYDDGVPLSDIRTAEAVGADWCVWLGAPKPGCRLEVTVGLALGVCDCMADLTISWLDW